MDRSHLSREAKRPRSPVSRANKIAAARVYISASAKSGQPVPDWIRQIAEEADC